MKKQATIYNGSYYCECHYLVGEHYNFCPICGAELEFVVCKHEECLAQYYIDYDRGCYLIRCKICNTIVADIRAYELERVREKYNITEER